MTRRQFMFGLSVSALALAVAGTPGVAWAQANRSRAINIDVRPVEVYGRNAHTVLLRQRLQQSMAQAFAGYSGPPITVRIYKMILSVSGIPNSRSPGTDYLEGEIIAGGRSIPILVTQNSDSAGYWRSPGYDDQRVIGLADAFAGWAKRKV